MAIGYEHFSPFLLNSLDPDRTGLFNKINKCTDSHCQHFAVLHGEEDYLGIREAFLVKAQEIKCLWDETKTLKEFLTIRRNSESSGYLPLSDLFPKI